MIVGLMAGFMLNAQEETPTNLLTNPGFEVPYETVGEEDQIAEGWQAWNLGEDEDRPSFSESIDRVLEGESAQEYASFFSTHTAGLYQVVEGLTAGQAVTFTANVYVWSTRDLSDPDLSVDPGGVQIQVGIDPQGGTDPESTSIIWSIPQEEYDTWVPLSVNTAPEADTISVWVRSSIANARLETHVYVDDAVLVVGDFVPLPEVTGEVTAEPQPEITGEATLTNTPEAPATEELVTTTPDPTIQAIATNGQATLAAQLTLEASNLTATQEAMFILATNDIINQTALAQTAIFQQATDASILTATQAAIDAMAGNAAADQTATQLAIDALATNNASLLTATQLAIDALATNNAEVVALTLTADALVQLGGTGTAVVLQGTADAVATQAAIDALATQNADMLNMTATAEMAQMQPLILTATAVIEQATANAIATLSGTATAIAAMSTESTDSLTATANAVGANIDAIAATATALSIQITNQAANLAGTADALQTAQAQPQQPAGTPQIIVVTATEPAPLAATATVDAGIIALATAGQQTLEAQGAGAEPTLIPSPTATIDIQGTLAPFPYRIEVVVRPGDTVYGLAQVYNSTMDAIIAANGLDATGLIQPNQTLIIPLRAAPTALPPAGGTGGMGSAPAIPTQTYTVVFGDTLSAIATRFNTTTAELARLNGITSVNSLRAGQMLRVPLQSTVTATRSYTVQYGDSLYTIALKYGVTIQQIAQLNNIQNVFRIYPGQVLRIP